MSTNSPQFGDHQATENQNREQSSVSADRPKEKNDHVKPPSRVSDTIRGVLIGAAATFFVSILIAYCSNYLTRRDEHQRDARTCDQLMSSLFSMITFAGETAKAASSTVGTPIPPTQKSNKFVFPPIDEILSAQNSLLGIIDAPSRNSVLEIQVYYRSIRDDLSNTQGVNHSGETYGVEPASDNIAFYKNLLDHLVDRANAAAAVLQNSTYCKQRARTNFW